MENRKYKILVVDDDYLSQRMMGLVLSGGGYLPSEAFDGTEAVEAVQLQHYDLILMDVQMPVLDGYSATRKIREWEAGKSHIPIIGLTAMVFEDDVQHCLDSGMDDCIIKPFDAACLYQLIDAHIEKSIVRKELPAIEFEEENPLLNIDGSLSRFGNNVHIYQEFLVEFLELLPERIKQFRAMFNSGDYHGLSTEAHNLKGVAASMGAMQLSVLASKLDHLSRNRDSKLIEEMLDACDNSVSTLQDNATKILFIYTQKEVGLSKSKAGEEWDESSTY